MELQTSTRVSRIPFAALTAGVASLASVSTRGGMGPWYRALRKSRLQPPRQAFAPVWTALYGLMAESAARVWNAPKSRARSAALALWGAQLAANGAWSYLFFEKRRTRTALKDIGLLSALVASYALVTRKVDRRASWMMVPYLGWLGFASMLNAQIVRKNRRWLPLLGAR